MQIPFTDLKAQYLSIKSEVDSAIQNVIHKTQFIGGSIKEEFEKNFAKAINIKHCIGVANGTDAIYISLIAMGIGPGDEVVVPANSFIATSESITIAGARVAFVDVDPKTFNMDLNKLENLLQKRSKKNDGKIKAIIPVHLYGRICDMQKIMELASKYEVSVLEDSAQAHLAQINKKNAGTWGAAGTFSFYPGKNLGAYGDAGCAVTDNDDLAQKIRKIANHGRVKKYDHDMEGFNSRLDTIQAAVLDVKLKHLKKWTDLRYQKAKKYSQMLSDYANHIVLPEIPEQGQHVFHLYVIRSKKRDQLLEFLKKSGVEASVHYPISLHNLNAYKYLGHSPEDFPVSSQLQSEILSLPLFPEITDMQQSFVVEKLAEFFKS